MNTTCTFTWIVWMGGNMNTTCTFTWIVGDVWKREYYIYTDCGGWMDNGILDKLIKEDPLTICGELVEMILFVMEDVDDCIFNGMLKLDFFTIKGIKLLFNEVSL